MCMNHVYTHFVMPEINLFNLFILMFEIVYYFLISLVKLSQNICFNVLHYLN